MPQLDALDVLLLDSHISVEKLESTIPSSKPGKSSGPDRLTAIYYKTFLTQLLLRLTSALNSLTDGSHLSRDSLWLSSLSYPRRARTPHHVPVTALLAPHSFGKGQRGLLLTFFLLPMTLARGAPFSPLLFIVSLEPFLQNIHANPNITGLSQRQTTYKISAYADDLLFFLTNPHTCFPCLMLEFNRYKTLVVLQINFFKSEAEGTPPPTLTHPFKSNWRSKFVI